MSRVLFLAYHFPPHGGAGVQRSVKLVRHLPDLGWDPVVVTGPGTPGGRWAPSDASLSAELPAQVPVHRVGRPEPTPAHGARARAERWLGAQSTFDEWWVRAAVSVGEGERGAVDAIWATMSPYASAVAAAALAERLDVPWVADLRDPWALDEMRVYPTRLHRRAEVARMRRSLGSAAAIVMNTGTAAEALVRTMPELSGRVDVIPNGFDAADFDGDPPARADDAFRIVHAGYLHTEDGLRHRRWSRRLLGGSVRGVDLLTRSAWYLVEALDGLCGRDPELARTVELHLAGVLSDADRVSVDRPYARLHGYLEHAKTLDLVRSADLLFLPMQNLRAGERATIVPGKTYEYLASGRPILAAVPDGDARDLLVRSGVARVCRPDDVAALADGVAAAVERWRRGERPRTAPAELLARFERRRLAEKAARILDGLGYASGSVPRLAPAPA